MGRHLAHHRAPQGTAAHLHEKFYVVTAITNPRRFGTRYELYNDFTKHMADSGATLYTIEGAFGGRAFALTDRDNPRHIQIRTPHELWHKENLLNIAISRLPSDWQYVAWIDADVHFVRPDWVNETIQMLQHHQIVQPWSQALDMSPSYEVMGRHESFVRSYQLGRPRKGFNVQPYYGQPISAGTGNIYHPGYAWAARREALDALGGLIDFAILGAGDNHFANCLIGDVHRSVHPKAHPNYLKWLYQWQDRAERHIRRNIGCVEGTILHHFHGLKKNRRYASRWQVLVHNDFDPEADLKRDVQGVWQLVDAGIPRHIRLRDEIMTYFKSRREDDICGECLGGDH